MIAFRRQPGTSVIVRVDGRPVSDTGNTAAEVDTQLIDVVTPADDAGYDKLRPMSATQVDQARRSVPGDDRGSSRLSLPSTETTRQEIAILLHRGELT